MSADPNALDSPAINALTGVLASSKARTFPADAGEGEHIVYIIPSSFGTPTFNVGGFDGGFKKAKTIEHTNASGYKQNYDIWQSVQPSLGSTSVTVKLEVDNMAQSIEGGVVIVSTLSTKNNGNYPLVMQNPCSFTEGKTVEQKIGELEAGAGNEVITEEDINGLF